MKSVSRESLLTAAFFCMSTVALGLGLNHILVKNAKSHQETYLYHCPKTAIGDDPLRGYTNVCEQIGEVTTMDWGQTNRPCTCRKR